MWRKSVIRCYGPLPRPFIALLVAYWFIFLIIISGNDLFSYRCSLVHSSPFLQLSRRAFQSPFNTILFLCSVIHFIHWFYSALLNLTIIYYLLFLVLVYVSFSSFRFLIIFLCRVGEEVGWGRRKHPASCSHPPPPAPPSLTRLSLSIHDSLQYYNFRKHTHQSPPPSHSFTHVLLSFGSSLFHHILTRFQDLSELGK